MMPLTWAGKKYTGTESELFLFKIYYKSFFDILIVLFGEVCIKDSISVTLTLILIINLFDKIAQ